MWLLFFFFKQKTAYEIYQCDWSSDVCSSDLQLTILEPEKLQPGKLICTSDRCLGHGTTHELRDMIIVKPDAFDISKTRTIAGEIGKLNRSLEKNQIYILMGPGRWGTADPFLGIPVTWEEISLARAIVEVGLPNLFIEPSFGSHFFQNLISLGISYFTIPPNRFQEDIDWKWLSGETAVIETTYLRHLRFKKPLPVRIDGRTGYGVIFKPDLKKFIK